MITGIGVDLIEIDRVTKACEKPGFLRRIYTEKEIELINLDIKKAADNFAVKEAVVKMFGTGFRGIAPIEIEVLRDDMGKPFVNLYGKAAKVAEGQGISVIHVSITNSQIYANAYVIGERRHPNEVCSRCKDHEENR
ncbi:MAG: holo-ACP synthase [Clostridiales bacterium]|jgi:holo-[acyl-carrier protein] synthase|nr:holo-ACP synthase [Clostridiales bacterium]